MTSSGVASSKIKLRSAFQDNLVDLVQVSTTASWFLEPPEASGSCRCHRLFVTKAFTGLEPMVTFPKSPRLAHDVNLGAKRTGGLRCQCRDHMPWYRVQRPQLFARAFDAAKGVFDPARILNPGVRAD